MSHNSKFERFRFSVLANNISGSVAIPLTLTPTPTTLTSLSIRSDRDDAVLLSATVGWTSVTPGTGLGRVNVLFKIWRGAPVTGTLIFSADDSAEFDGFDINRVTSFSHVDTSRSTERSTSPRATTYFLTAELPDAGSAATVIGPITFTAAEIERA